MQRMLRTVFKLGQLILAVLIVMTAPAASEPGDRDTVLPTIIDSTLQLSAENSPYLAIADVLVGEDGYLWAHPGTIIHMSEGVSITVLGRIGLLGNEGNPVTIMPVPGANHWGAICLDYANDVSVFSYVDISGATEGPFIPNWFAAISSVHSEMLIEHCVFHQNVDCIYSYNGDMVVRDCVFENDNLGEFVYGRNCHATVDRCQMYTVAGYGDAIDFNGVYDAHVRDCTFLISGGDLLDFDLGTEVNVTRCVLITAGDRGLDITENSIANFSYNLISDCYVGASVSDGAVVTFDHCTFHDNGTGVKVDNEDAGAGGGTGFLTNCIFSQNGLDLDVDSYGTATVDYCLSDMELHAGVGNLHGDPLLADPVNLDFNLTSDSPCIDTGDPAADPDPDGTRTDMGAYFFNQIGLGLVINEINYNSSADFNPGDWLELRNLRGGAIDLVGFTIEAAVDDIYTFPAETVIDGYGYFVLCRNSMAFEECFPEVEDVIMGLTFNLSGDEQTLALHNAEGILLDQVTYDSNPPWPTEPDGGGPTLELIDPDWDHDLPTSWAASSAPHGTPGMPNSVAQGVAVQEDGDAPIPVLSLAAYPNPFNPEVKLVFRLPRAVPAQLEIFDSRGRRVWTQTLRCDQAGLKSITWRGSDDSGAVLASGVYHARLSQREYSEQTRLVLLK